MNERTPATTLTDDELAVAFAARRAGAFEEVYRRHLDVLFAVARGVSASTPDAQDCVHDTLVRVWLAPSSYRVERGALRSFLIVAVRNEALTRRRAAARHLELERREAGLTAFESSGAFEITDHVARAQLRDALQALPAEQRSVIELAYFELRTQTQIAAQLGIPLGTVKSRASLALRKLAIALGPAT